jgi:mycothiol synthase
MIKELIVMLPVETHPETRPFLGEDDFARIVELWNTCDVFDQLGEGTTENQLRVEFADPWLDVERNVRLWEDGNGKLIGFCQIWIPPSSELIEGRVIMLAHPEQRPNGLETQILDWADERLRAISRERAIPALSRVAVRDTQASQIALLESRGMRPERYTFVMTRSLDDLPQPVLPEGFTIREIRDESDGEAWVEMFNLSFIDHWNHHPLTLERWKNWLTDPNELSDLNLVAIAPDGTFAAFCWAGIDPEENQRSGKKVGWVHVLGTRRGFRRIGLGRGILLTGLQRLKARGIETAKLGVDAQSLTGATRLYEAVGFSRSETWAKFIKDL